MENKKVLMMMGLVSVMMLGVGFSQTSGNAVVKVSNKVELVAEIRKATAGGNWTADLNYIDTSAVRDMSDLFSSDDDEDEDDYDDGYQLGRFNGRIDKWDVSNVRNMEDMFKRASSFNQPIGNWNVSNVVNMDGMFEGASSFNQDIGNWNVSNVMDMDGMFERASSFNQDLSQWDVSNVTSMEDMFKRAKSFNQNLSKWNVSAVRDMKDMFNQSGMKTLPKWCDETCKK